MKLIKINISYKGLINYTNQQSKVYSRTVCKWLCFYSCCELQLHLVPKKGFLSEQRPHSNTHSPVERNLFFWHLAVLHSRTSQRFWSECLFFLLNWGLKSFPTSQACGPQQRKHSTMNCSFNWHAPGDLWAATAMLVPICSKARLPAPPGLGISCEFKASKGFENVQKVKC